MCRIPFRQTLSVALFFLLGTLSIAAPRANAQWIVIELHPADATESYAYGGDGIQQAGTVIKGGVQRASLWSGTAASWVDLSPPGATQSFINGANGGQQTGTVNLGGAIHASLWTGTAASRVDLHPAAAPYDSGAYGVSGSYQVGYVSLNGALHASLWNGTAASWVDLYPLVGAWDDSRAFGVGGGQQVGWVGYTFDVLHASLWSGTAASWVNLSPAGTDESAAYGVDGGQQAGMTISSSVGQHAALWTGTAASWVDLNPPGAIQSFAYGIHHGQEVGAAFVGGVERASLWSGTAASWEDLHAFVPAKYSRSEAYGITHDGGFTYVTGVGLNATTQHFEALMWVKADPCLPRSWSGVLPPINADGTSVFKLGRTIPVKFQLTGSCSSDTTLEARLYVTKVSGGGHERDSDHDGDAEADSTSGHLFRYSDGQYIYNLRTDRLSRGTWQLRIDLGDGVMHTVLISLRGERD